MKRFVLLSALLASVFALPAFGEVTAGSAIPDRPANNVIMIFNTDPAEQCFRAAQDGMDLRFGLEHCNTAMRDPLATYRAQTVVNRGIIRYDMGDLNDGIAQAAAGTNQMKTAPLWGLRVRTAFLHDGSAPTIDASIRAHDGESARSRDRYIRRPKFQQQQLIDFLNSI